MSRSRLYPDHYDDVELIQQDPDERPVTETIDRKLAAAALGRIRSSAKARASRENGKKGGRPKGSKKP